MGTVPAIALEQVTKYYGADKRAMALHELNLEVPAGQFLSVMGPSGSGKTTLLNLIAGLDTPDAGRIALGGVDLGALSDDARADLRLQQIGFVFQLFNLFPSFTVEENVAWPLEFSGLRKRVVEERVAATLDEVGLAAATRSRRPTELSGGEQQRVAIARALATAPSILLADEPTGSLDSHMGRTILDLLRRLNAQRQLTVVLVTHSPIAAMYGHRILEMCDGRIAGHLRVRGQSLNGAA